MYLFTIYPNIGTLQKETDGYLLRSYIGAIAIQLHFKRKQMGSKGLINVKPIKTRIQ
jgi:hypothetical protein